MQGCINADLFGAKQSSETPVGNIYVDTSRAHEVEIVDHDKRKKNRALELLQKNFKAIMDQEGRK